MAVKDTSIESFGLEPEPRKQKESKSKPADTSLGSFGEITTGGQEVEDTQKPPDISISSFGNIEAEPVYSGLDDKDEGILSSAKNIAVKFLGGEQKDFQLSEEYLSGLDKELRNNPEKLKKVYQQSEKADPGLEQAWNPATVFASIYGGAAAGAMKVGGYGIKQAAKIGLQEAAIGTTADVPIYLAGEKLRDNYGWGPGLLGEVALSFTSAFTIERFISNKLNQVGKGIRSLDDLASKPADQQTQMMDDLDKMFRVSSDRPEIITPTVSEISIDRPVGLDELGNISQITSRGRQIKEAKEVVTDTIRKKDGTPFQSAKSAKRAIKRKNLSEDFQPVEVSDGWVLQGPRFQRAGKEISEESVKEFSVSSGYLSDNPRTENILAERDKLAAERAAYRNAQETVAAQTRFKEGFDKDVESLDRSIVNLENEFGLAKMTDAMKASNTQPDDPDVFEEIVESVDQKALVKVASEEDKFVADMTQLTDDMNPKEIPRASDEIAEETGRKERYNKFLSKVGRRIASEDYAEGMLGDIEASGRSVKKVSEEFWESIYPKLDDDAKANVHRQLKAVSGFEPGSVVAVEKGGKEITANTWKEVGRELEQDLPTSPEYLEGLEKGYIGMLENANQAFRETGEEGVSAATRGADETPAEEGITIEASQEGITSRLSDEYEPTADDLEAVERELVETELVSEEEMLRYADELGIEKETPEGVKKDISADMKAQEDIEEFLDEGLENFSGGDIREGRMEDVGFEDDFYFNEGRLTDDNMIDAEDSTRDLGDMLQDLNTVMGGKVGLSIEDVAKNADRNSAEAAERLTQDLFHYNTEATRAGLDLQDYLMQKGFTKPVAQKLKGYSDMMFRSDEEVIDKAVEQGNIDIKAQKAFRGPLPKFAIEVPFRKMGAPNTGHAVKTHHSVVGLSEDEGKKMIGQLSDQYRYFEESDWGRVLMRAEDMDADGVVRKGAFDISDLNAGKQEDIDNAAYSLRKYFDKSFKDLENQGVLERGFKDSYIARQEKNLTKYQEKLETVKRPATKEKYHNLILETQEKLDYVKNAEYVPALSWLDSTAHENPARFGKQASILNQKQRSVPSLRYLHDKGLVNLEEVDARNILGMYAHRKGKDLANQRIKNALLNDGLVKEIPKGRRPSDFPEHWPEIDKSQVPMLKNHVAQPKVAEFLKSYYSSLGPHTKFERALTTIKMGQFFNPVVMPMYDTYQTAVLHGVQSWRIPKHIVDGVKSVMKQDQDFRDLSWYGGYSKPFQSTMASWQDEINAAKMPGGKRFKNLFDKSPIQMIKNAYQLSWDAAWGGDRMIRMASYKELRRVGVNKKDAAQLTALFHGDYASVPPKTRRWMNNLLFTPTFKIVMAKWQMNMASAMMETGERAARKSLPGVPNKSIGMKRRILAGGMLGLAGANLGKDMLMKSMGFESDEWGRRYYKEADTDEGPKEIVVTYSDPVNMALKYMYKGLQSIQPGGDTTMKNLWNAAKFDIHPAWRIIGHDLAQNSRISGEQIYSPTDDSSIKTLKSLSYVFEQAVPLLDRAVGTFGIGITEEEEKERKIVEEELGKITAMFLDTIAFTYVRGPRKQAIQYKIDKIKTDTFNAARKGNLSPGNLENQQEKIDDLRREMEALP